MEPSNAPALVFKEAKKAHAKAKTFLPLQNVNSSSDQTQVRSNRPR